MKKVFFLLLLLAGINGAATAQAAKTNVNTKSKATTVSSNGVTTTKTHVISNRGVSKTKVSTTTRPVSGTVSSSRAKLKQDGSPDRRYKVNSGLKKDGTPDKRYKANKKS